MALKTFIDIGSHFGESLEEALRPIYGFDLILAVEPSTYCNTKLYKFKDNRIKFFQFAITDYNGEANLFGSGSIGASLYSDKKNTGKKCEIVKTMRFSDFINTNTKPEDEIYIKINIEGSEITLLNEIRTITRNIVSILLSVDIGKIPSLMQHNSKFYESINDLPFPVHIRNHKDNQIAINMWLASTDILISPKGISKVKDYTRPYLPFNRNLLRLAKPFVPKTLWLRIALRFGPNRTL